MMETEETLSTLTTAYDRIVGQTAFLRLYAFHRADEDAFGEYTAASRGLDRIADDHLGVLAQIGQAKRAACHQVIVALRDGGLARAGDKRAALHFRVGDGSHLAGVVGHLADKAEHAVHGRYEIVLVDAARAALVQRQRIRPVARTAGDDLGADRRGAAGASGCPS